MESEETRGGQQWDDARAGDGERPAGDDGGDGEPRVRHDGDDGKRRGIDDTHDGDASHGSGDGHDGGDGGDGVRAVGGIQAPRGTMALVVVYLSAVGILWAYMYLILLRSEGVWGVMHGGM